MSFITFLIASLALAAKSVEDCADAVCDEQPQSLQVGLLQTGLVHGATLDGKDANASSMALISKRSRSTTNYQIMVTQQTRRRRNQIDSMSVPRRRRWNGKCLSADEEGVVTLAACNSMDDQQLFNAAADGDYCTWTMASNANKRMSTYTDRERDNRIGMCENGYIEGDECIDAWVELEFKSGDNEGRRRGNWLANRKPSPTASWSQDIGIEPYYTKYIILDTNTFTRFRFRTVVSGTDATWDSDNDDLESGDMPCGETIS